MRPRAWPAPFCARAGPGQRAAFSRARPVRGGAPQGGPAPACAGARPLFSGLLSPRKISRWAAPPWWALSPALSPARAQPAVQAQPAAVPRAQAARHRAAPARPAGRRPAVPRARPALRCPAQAPRCRAHPPAQGLAEESARNSAGACARPAPCFLISRPAALRLPSAFCRRAKRAFSPPVQESHPPAHRGLALSAARSKPALHSFPNSRRVPRALKPAGALFHTAQCPPQQTR